MTTPGSLTASVPRRLGLQQVPHTLVVELGRLGLGDELAYALSSTRARLRSSNAFEDEDGRQAHFSGEVAQALAQNAELFADAPSIHQVDLLASK